MTPLVLNPISLTSAWDELGSAGEFNSNVDMEPFQRLPTPEEKMRQQAEAVAADIVPINVTGMDELTWNQSESLITAASETPEMWLLDEPEAEVSILEIWSEMCLWFKFVLKSDVTLI